MKAFRVMGVLGLVSVASACTIVVVARSGEVFAGGNEDEATKPQLASHFIRFSPGNNEKGTLGFAAFGYKNNPFSDEAAINEAGLFYDFNALETLDKPRVGKPTGAFNTVNRMLTSCRTVAEAVALLEAVDLPQMSGAQIVLGDATGASVILERQATTWRAKGRDFQIGTNFRTSTTPEESVTCDRYRLCQSRLSPGSKITLTDMAGILKATAAANAETTTWYSLICDLKRKDVYLAVHGDFAKTVKFNLATELTKGPRRLDMEDFVKNSPSTIDWSRVK